MKTNFYCSKCNYNLTYNSIYITDDYKMYCLDCSNNFCKNCTKNGFSVYGGKKYNNHNLCNKCYDNIKIEIIKDKCDYFYSIFNYI